MSGNVVYTFVNKKNETVVVRLTKKSFQSPKETNKEITITVTAEKKGKSPRYPIECKVGVDTAEDAGGHFFVVSDWHCIERKFNGRGWDIKKGIEEYLNKQEQEVAA